MPFIERRMRPKCQRVPWPEEEQFAIQHFLSTIRGGSLLGSRCPAGCPPSIVVVPRQRYPTKRIRNRIWNRKRQFLSYSQEFIGPRGLFPNQRVLGCSFRQRKQPQPEQRPQDTAKQRDWVERQPLVRTVFGREGRRGKEIGLRLRGKKRWPSSQPESRSEFEFNEGHQIIAILLLLQRISTAVQGR